MLLREFMDREVYKQAKYIKYVDEDGVAIQERKILKNIEVLYCKELEDGGLLFKLWICNKIPTGWKIRVGALTAPNGYRWISNGKSIFSNKHKSTLLRIK